MALFKSEGIVFRSLKYREASLIVDIYTSEKGLRSFIVNGVRKPKSRMPAAIFQHGNLVEIIAYEKEGQNLNRLKEIRIAIPYQEIPYKIEKSSIGIFMIELIRNAVREHEQNENLFYFIKDRMIRLDQLESGIAIYHLKFLLDFSQYIGFHPMNNYDEGHLYFDLEEATFLSCREKNSTIDKEKSSYIHILMKTDIDLIHHLKIPKAIRLSLIDNLLHYYRYHIEGFRELQSLQVYRQLF